MIYMLLEFWVLPYIRFKSVVVGLVTITKKKVRQKKSRSSYSTKSKSGIIRTSQ